MRSFNRGRTAATLCLTLCLLASQVLAAPATPAGERGRSLGEITFTGQVLVDGEDAVSGTTVFPGSRFTTSEGSEAVINLGEVGRLRLAPETASMINFGERQLDGTLDAGVITVSKPEGVSAVFSTKDGQVVAGGDSAAVFTLNVTGGNTVVKTEAGRVELRAGKDSRTVAAGQTGSAGQGGGGGNSGNGHGRGLALGVIGFTGLVLAAAIYAITHDDDPNTTPGNVIVISPSR